MRKGPKPVGITQNGGPDNTKYLDGADDNIWGQSA